MDTTIEKKAHVFHLPEAVNHEPNEETAAAFCEARAGKLEGPVDPSSVKSMLKSMKL